MACFIPLEGGWGCCCKPTREYLPDKKKLWPASYPLEGGGSAAANQPENTFWIRKRLLHKQFLLYVSQMLYNRTVCWLQKQQYKYIYIDSLKTLLGLVENILYKNIFRKYCLCNPIPGVFRREIMFGFQKF